MDNEVFTLELFSFPQVLYSGKNFVACAPTGSGKTVLFELAIVRLLLETSEPWKDVKAVYSKEMPKFSQFFVHLLLPYNSLLGVSQLNVQVRVSRNTSKLNIAFILQRIIILLYCFWVAKICSD